MFVIATAGHIDHGKSTLVEALTGIHPDRLKEEKERGMTIDLGFAHFTLPSGREVGVVDVPGHHRFIRNMLAGVGGTGVVMFVVAATESWMPQSQEHLEIVDLLGVERGVIVLSKVDLVEDEWIDMVEEEVRDKVRGTSLEKAPVVRVSAVRGDGLEELVSELDRQIARIPEPEDVGRPRMWIDRAFTIRGTGTVVTGALEGGSLKLEDELELLPSGDLVRVRGLQTYGRRVEAVPAGRRAAVNLAGVDVGDVERGDVLAGPGHIRASERFNVALRTVASLERPVEREATFKLHVGTAERLARVKLLDKETVGPGEEVLAQVEVDRPCAVQWNDRLVLRDPARQATVGGGKVLVAAARRVRGKSHRYPRSERSAVHRVLAGEREEERLDLGLLRARLHAGPAQLIEVEVTEQGWIDRRNLQQVAPFASERLEEAVGELARAGRLRALSTYLVSAPAWSKLKERVESELAAYHAEYPLRSGLPRETLRSSLGVDWRLFDAIVDGLEQEGVLVSEGARVKLAGHEVRFSAEEERLCELIVGALRAAPFAPPDVKEVAGRHGYAADGDELDEIIGALVEQGKLVRVGKELLFAAEAIEEIRRRVVAYLKVNPSIDVAVLRDMLATTRKYAVPLLEYLDQIEVTRRVGDLRVLGPRAVPAGGE